MAYPDASSVPAQEWRPYGNTSFKSVRLANLIMRNTVSWNMFHFLIFFDLYCFFFNVFVVISVCMYVSNCQHNQQTISKIFQGNIPDADE